MTWIKPEPMPLERHDAYLDRVVGSFESYINEERTMIEVQAPTQETIREGRSTRRRTVFDVIENPEPGWVTRKIKRKTTIDSEPTWLVQMIHESDGASVEFEHESLYIAWVRATEQAHSYNAGLFAD